MRCGATSQERWPSLENYLPQSTLNAESIERSQHVFKVGLVEFAFGALRLEITFARLDRDLTNRDPGITCYRLRSQTHSGAKYARDGKHRATGCGKPYGVA